MIDPDLDDDEALLAATTRTFFDAFIDNEYLNTQERSPNGYEAGRWQRMCDLGWTAINLPARVGGGDGSLAEAALVARECGRAAFASPLLQTMRAATALEVIGGDKAFDDTLGQIAAGMTGALIAPPDRVVTAQVGDTVVLSGAPAAVEWLEQAETLVLLVPAAEGTEWFAAVLPVELLAGRSRPAPSIDNERIALIELDGLALPRKSATTRVIPEGTARLARSRADLLRASSMVGGCDAVLGMTIRYAKERYQFGQPIGAFQAVRHHLARMLIAADAARLTCNEALAKAGLDADEPATAAVAAFAAGRSYVEIVITAAQVHGGIGTTTEHILHHHFSRAKAGQLRMGRRASRLREITESLVVQHQGSLW